MVNEATKWGEPNPDGKAVEDAPMNLAIIILILLLSAFGQANAETVDVKYRGLVDLAPFTCETVTRSSLVQRVCYDPHEQYMIINLQGTYYHYCEIDAGTVDQLRTAPSMGRYYSAVIKGNFDCRTRRVPAYR